MTAERGYEVHLIVDATSSKYLTDRAVGIQVHAPCLGGSVSALSHSQPSSTWHMICHICTIQTCRV